MKNKCRSISLLLTMAAAVLMLASCASTTPPGRVQIPDLPPELTANPPEFRLLKSQKSVRPTPPAASSGVNKP